MKLYTSMGPNPGLVQMFLAIKGVKIEEQAVDLMAGENRKEEYLAVNPAGQIPALQLDNGTVISEITAICEYIEEIHPENPLIGSTPEERAEARMWTRRVDLKVCEPLGSGFRYAEGAPIFKDRMRILPDAAEGLKALAQDGIQWLDGQLEGKKFLAGDRLTLADLLLFCFLEFGNGVGQPLDANNTNIQAWHGRIKELTSAG
ncbi:MAG: glutathione S-transferase family protein [Pseudomonadales bacterium]|nr:glutathione S-transferase family protein [Pseudomonadales bacterium]